MTFSRRPAPLGRMNRRGVGVASGGAVPQPTPLLRWDARDYEDALPGAAITGALTPAIGSAVTFQGSPVWKANIIGGGMAFQTPGVDAGFAAHWLAPVMNGSDKPCTMIMRAIRGSTSAVVWGGFGSSLNATIDFCELLTSSAVTGAPQARKDAHALEATVTRSGANVIGFQENILALVTNGNQVWLYVNKVLQTGFPMGFDTLPVEVDQFRFGCSGRTTGTLGTANSLFQAIEVYDTALSQAQVEAACDRITARDVPPPAGAPIYFLGDSITRGDAGAGGMRLELYNHIQAESYGIDMQGSFSTGSFPDNQHSGVNGVEIASMAARATAELGTGKPFPGIKLVLVMAGTNNVNNVGYDNAATLVEYANMLETIFTAASSTVATVRIAVTTLLPFEPGAAGDTNVPLFNAGLDAVWDAFDAAHPSNTLLRWDANAAMGAWSSAYFVDSAHPNSAGFARICQDPTNGLIQAVDSYLASISI